MKKNKDVKDETTEKFLDRGGKIEVLPPMSSTHKSVVNATSHKGINLLSLSEAEELYGEAPKRKIKVKKFDVSDINMSLIPEHIKRLILSKVGSDNTKESE